MTSILELIYMAIENNGIAKIETNRKRPRTYSEYILFFEYNFIHIIENGYFLISPLAYKRTTETTKKQKDFITDVIFKIDESFIYLDIFSLFQMKTKNVSDLHSFARFFEIIRKEYIEHNKNYKSILSYETRPVRLKSVGLLNNVEHTNSNIEINDLIENNEHINNWIVYVAKNLRAMGPHSWINIPYTTVLNAEESRDFFLK